MSPHAAPLHGSLPPSEPSEVTLGGSGEMTLGVMGGGQLGRMFVQAAQQMGFFTAVLDADPLSPAGRVSHHHIQTAYTDADGLQRLAQRCVAVTTEFRTYRPNRWPHWHKPSRCLPAPIALPSRRIVRAKNCILRTAVCR